MDVRVPIKGHFDVLDEPMTHRDDPTAIIERYGKIAEAAINDAAIRLRQGALSRAIPEPVSDAIMVVEAAGLIQVDDCSAHPGRRLLRRRAAHRATPPGLGRILI
jgi:hypothetical protein